MCWRWDHSTIWTLTGAQRWSNLLNYGANKTNFCPWLTANFLWSSHDNHSDPLYYFTRKKLKAHGDSQSNILSPDNDPKDNPPTMFYRNVLSEEWAQFAASGWWIKDPYFPCSLKSYPKATRSKRNKHECLQRNQKTYSKPFPFVLHLLPPTQDKKTKKEESDPLLNTALRSTVSTVRAGSWDLSFQCLEVPNLSSCPWPLGLKLGQLIRR